MADAKYFPSCASNFKEWAGRSYNDLKKIGELLKEDIYPSLKEDYDALYGNQNVLVQKGLDMYLKYNGYNNLVKLLRAAKKQDDFFKLITGEDYGLNLIKEIRDDLKMLTTSESDALTYICNMGYAYNQMSKS